MIFDTSSSLFWLPNSQCGLQYACTSRCEILKRVIVKKCIEKLNLNEFINLLAATNYYMSNISTTYQPNNKSFSYSYVDSFGVIGYYSQDTVSFGSFKIENQTFGQVTKMSNLNVVTPQALQYDVRSKFLINV